MPVVVTYLGATFTAASPIITGMVLIIREIGGAVFLGTGQDIVLIGLVVPAFDSLPSFVERGLEGNGFVVEMQIRWIGCDQGTPGIVPGAIADSLPSEYAPLARLLCTQVGTPLAITGAYCRRQLLAMGIGTFQTTQITPFPGPELVTKNPIGRSSAMA